MVGGRSGIAVKFQVMVSLRPRSVALPPSVMVKRCASVPAGVGVGVVLAAAVRPPLTATSRLDLPVARITSVEPAGTATGAAARTGSPERTPGRITGGRPV